MGLGFFIISIIMYSVNKILVYNPQETVLNSILILSGIGGISKLKIYRIVKKIRRKEF